MELELLDVQQVIDRLVRDADWATDLVAFDADGTLWSGDIGVDTFERLLDSQSVRTMALPELQREADAYGLARSDNPSHQARIIFDAFRRRELPDELGVSLMAWGYAGFTTDEVAQFARDSVRATALHDRLQRPVIALMEWAQRGGLPVYVVSASPVSVIVEAVAPLGVPAERVVAAAPVVSEGRIQPRMERLPYADGKRSELRAIEPTARLLAAFGDSGFDLELLAESLHPIAVAPKASLRARAAELPRLRELRFPGHERAT